MNSLASCPTQQTLSALQLNVLHPQWNRSRSKTGSHGRVVNGLYIFGVNLEIQCFPRSRVPIHPFVLGDCRRSLFFPVPVQDKNCILSGAEIHFILLLLFMWQRRTTLTFGSKTGQYGLDLRNASLHYCVSQINNSPFCEDLLGPDPAEVPQSQTGLLSRNLQMNTTWIYSHEHCATPDFNKFVGIIQW